MRSLRTLFARQAGREGVGQFAQFLRTAHPPMLALEGLQRLLGQLQTLQFFQLAAQITDLIGRKPGLGSDPVPFGDGFPPGPIAPAIGFELRAGPAK